MFKYYNPRIVKKYRSYTVEQICTVFREKKLHPQTIREWVKSGALEAIAKNPISIYGEVLIDFLEKRNSSHKKHLDFNQFKCIKCQKFVSPKNNIISHYIKKNGSIKATAICPSCNCETTRFYKKGDQAKLEKIFIIKKVEGMTLYNSLPCSAKTHLDCSLNESQSESSKTSRGSTSKTNIILTQMSLFELL